MPPGAPGTVVKQYDQLMPFDALGARRVYWHNNPTTPILRFPIQNPLYEN